MKSLLLVLVVALGIGACSTNYESNLSGLPNCFESDTHDCADCSCDYPAQCHLTAQNDTYCREN